MLKIKTVGSQEVKAGWLRVPGILNYIARLLPALAIWNCLIQKLEVKMYFFVTNALEPGRWLTLILTLRKLIQDCQEFKTCLGYVVRSCPFLFFYHLNLFETNKQKMLGGSEGTNISVIELLPTMHKRPWFDAPKNYNQEKEVEWVVGWSVFIWVFFAPRLWTGSTPWNYRVCSVCGLLLWQ